MVRAYLTTILLLSIALFVRLYNLDTLPIFIDEMDIIEWSELTSSGSPFVFGSQGRYLLSWALALFNPALVYDAAGDWLARTVGLLLIMPGLAAVVRIGRYLHSWQAGWLALILVIFAPMLHFHDRLLLADTALHSFFTLFIASQLLLFRSQRFYLWRGALVGVIFVLCLLTKASALVILPLPLVAAVLLPDGWSGRARITSLAVMYGTMLLLWMPFQGILWLRDYDFFSRAGRGTAGTSLIDLERIVRNTIFLVDGLSGYFAPGLMMFAAVFVGITVLRRRRVGLFLLVAVGAFTFALILLGGSPLYYRYWLPPLPVLLVLVAVGLLLLSRKLAVYSHRPVLRQAVPLVFVALWLMAGVPFIYLAAVDPAELDLPALDHFQYIQADSSGIGIRQVAEILADVNDPIYGAFAQCDTLDFYMPGRDVHCIGIAGTTESRIQEVNTLLDSLASPFYLVLEQTGQVKAPDIAMELRIVERIYRPDNLTALEVYHISP